MNKYRLYYMLMIPGILFYIIFCYLPMYGIIIAFKDVKPFQGTEQMLAAPFIGFRHFINFFKSYYFLNIIGNTFAISFLRLIFGFPAPIIFALLLNELKNGLYKRFAQSVSYMPYFISTVVLAGLVTTMLSTNGGLVNEIIKIFGGQPVFFMGSEKYFRSVLILSGIWKSMGWDSIIYLASIASINPEYYEASIVDGASKLKMVWHITLPGITPVVVIMLIFAVGNLMNAGFEQILLFYSPPVYKVADIIDTYVYRMGILGAKYSYSTAIGLFKSVVSMVLLLGANYVAKKFEQEGIW